MAVHIRKKLDLESLTDERSPTSKCSPAAQAAAVSLIVGICGQAPSNYPDFAAFRVETGIDSILLNPDSCIAATRTVAAMEQRLGRLSNGRQDTADGSHAG